MYNPDRPNELQLNRDFYKTHISAYCCPSDQLAMETGSPCSGPGSNLTFSRSSYRGVAGYSDCPATALNFWDVDDNGKWDIGNMMGPLHHVGTGNRKCESADDITDGLSHTLLAGEKTFYFKAGEDPKHTCHGTYWAYSYAFYNVGHMMPESRSLMLDAVRCFNVGGTMSGSACVRGWASYHSDLVPFVACDGSVHNIHTLIDMEVFKAYGTIRGGEPSRIE